MVKTESSKETMIQKRREVYKSAARGASEGGEKGDGALPPVVSCVDAGKTKESGYKGIKAWAKAEDTGPSARGTAWIGHMAGAD